MKLPRWLVVCLLATSAAVVIVSAVWWWITWPSQSIRDFTSLLEHRRFEEADRLLRRPARLTVDGGSPTLRDAIVRHRGNAARISEAFQKLDQSDQEAVIAFLKTLKAPSDALPIESSSSKQFAQR